jgi:hypothetical protein
MHDTLRKGIKQKYRMKLSEQFRRIIDKLKEFA